ncbi:MAG: type 1 glutamine amidotransferase domain-containing protein [Polyangia bacterium]|jgi:putative intracellular protease/amidase
MSKRVLIATTSHTRQGNTGKPTGAYLSEVAHPYEVFRRAGYQIDFASVQGGQIPLDGVADADAVSRAFLTEHGADLAASQAAANVDPSRYDAIFFAGGHGTMWDLPDDRAFQRVTAAIYERGGVVAAVCHGPAALVNVKLTSGKYLVDGKQVSAFTNEEERAVKLDEVVPFLLADALTAHGAQHDPAPKWQKKVVISERLVTGQNPASAAGVADGVVDLLKNSAQH